MAPIAALVDVSVASKARMHDLEEWTGELDTWGLRLDRHGS
jgi:hypothetical protein